MNNLDRRLPSYKPESLPGGEILDALNSVSEKIQKGCGRDSDVQLALSVLLGFVIAYNKVWVREKHQPIPEHLPDIRTLQGTQTGCLVAQEAWMSMKEKHAWSPRHTRRMQTQLGKVLSNLVPSLVGVINPAARIRQTETQLEASRSYDTDFILQECLPLHVRQLPLRSVRYRLLEKVANEFILHVRSLTRESLKRTLAVIDKILHTEVNGKSWLLMSNCIDEQWRQLKQVSPENWLKRYAEVFSGNQTMGLSLFRRHVRILSILHAKVFSPKTSLVIPLPKIGGIVHQGLSNATGESSAPSGSTLFATSGSSELDESLRKSRQRLLEILAGIRKRICKCTGDEDDKIFAFSPQEVRKILSSAVTTLERLVVWVFLTTGLRIGGLARLQVGIGPYEYGSEVPKIASTVEKNGKSRTVFIGHTGRILICRWFREERPSSGTRFLFPSHVRPDRNASTRWIWTICMRVFRNAGLLNNNSISHVHPHTFRHTFVHYMYMTGHSFEQIAKFIGHSNPATTSGIYGRLRIEDAETNAVGLPWLEDSGSTNTKEEWESIGKLLLSPWTFSPDEWTGLTRSTADPKAHKARRLAECRKETITEIRRNEAQKPINEDL